MRILTCERWDCPRPMSIHLDTLDLHICIAKAQATCVLRHEGGGRTTRGAGAEEGQIGGRLLHQVGRARRPSRGVDVGLPCCWLGGGGPCGGHDGVGGGRCMMCSRALWQNAKVSPQCQSDGVPRQSLTMSLPCWHRACTCCAATWWGVCTFAPACTCTCELRRLCRPMVEARGRSTAEGHEPPGARAVPPHAAGRSPGAVQPPVLPSCASNVVLLNRIAMTSCAIVLYMCAVRAVPGCTPSYG